MAAPRRAPTRSPRFAALAAARDPADLRLIRTALGIALGAALSAGGWSVFAARSAAAAARAARARRFDLMVLSFPSAGTCCGRTGLETARRLRALSARRADCAIIAVTARADAAFRDAAAEAGIDGYVEAPHAAQRLPDLIALLAPKSLAAMHTPRARRSDLVQTAKLGDVQY